MSPRFEMSEFVFAVVLGAFGPFRGVDRWFWRLAWWQKALWQFALTVLGVFGGSLANRLARPS